MIAIKESCRDPQEPLAKAIETELVHRSMIAEDPITRTKFGGESPVDIRSKKPPSRLVIPKLAIQERYLKTRYRPEENLLLATKSIITAITEMQRTSRGNDPLSDEDHSSEEESSSKGESSDSGDIDDHRVDLMSRIEAEKGRNRIPLRRTNASDPDSRLRMKAGSKEYVLAECSRFGCSLVDASDEMKNNKEVVLAACSQEGDALEFASKELQNDKEIVLLACSQNCHALRHASEGLKNDKQIVQLACSQNGYALKYASEELRDDNEIVLAACSKDGSALEYASEKLKNDKEVVLAACSRNGYALEFASESLRANKDVVLVAVESNPLSLKFALGRLNQDKDCLIKAGLWDENHIEKKSSSYDMQDNKLPKKIVLSTKFSLSAKSSAHATQFTLELKNHPCIKSENFIVYSPNAFDKGTCDPNWTNFIWPCRGTYDSCQKPPHLKTGVPQEYECCWRYSFRYQLKEAEKSGGFMIQVVDAIRVGKFELGDGQKIESDMASDVGIKTFRFFEPEHYYLNAYAKVLDELVCKIQDWYNDGCRDMKICNVMPAGLMAENFKL